MKLTAIWIVRDPQPWSELVDIVFEASPKKLAHYIIGVAGCASNPWEAENHTMYTEKAEAMADAKERLARQRRTT